MNVLAISGSLRAESSNTHALRALQLLAPADILVEFHDPLDSLPFFNPDVEEAGPPPVILAWRGRIAASNALVISSPEYAHGVSGVLKNALDWLVGGVEVVGKPIAVLNTRPQARIAHGALVETLRVMGGRVAIEASLPLTGRHLSPQGIASDPELSTILRGTLVSLARATESTTGERTSLA